MGKRDLKNPWGDMLPPVVVIGVREGASTMTAQERAAFEEAERKMDEAQRNWVASGSPWTDDQEAFLNRMTGV